MSRLIRKRAGRLLVSLVLAGLATGVLITYVNNVEERAFAGIETVDVLVAKDDIPARTSAQAIEARGLVVREKVPRKLVADDTVRSLGQIAGKVTTAPILKGEQLLVRRFAVPAEGLASVLPIPPQRQAITVQVGIPEAVGGFVRPGDRVSVIAKLELPPAEVSRLAGGSGVDTIARFLLQNVLVLAVNTEVAGLPNRSNGDERGRESREILLTLAVRPGEAEKVAFAALEGELYFTLLAKSESPASTRGRSANTIFR